MRSNYKILNLALGWIFWHLFPTTEFRAKWPVGEVAVTPEIGATQQLIMSADPNDHYRPWMEANIGKQGWDWDWKITGNDVADNCLTIRVRQDKAKYAIIAAMQWA